MVIVINHASSRMAGQSSNNGIVSGNTTKKFNFTPFLKVGVFDFMELTPDVVLQFR